MAACATGEERASLHSDQHANPMAGICVVLAELVIETKEQNMQPQVTPSEPNYDDNHGTQSGGVTLDNILARLQDLLHEGNVRRVIARNPQGAVMLDVPLTIVVIVTLVAPWLVAIGAVLALAASYKIEMERRD